MGKKETILFTHCFQRYAGVRLQTITGHITKNIFKFILHQTTVLSQWILSTALRAMQSDVASGTYGGERGIATQTK